MALGLVAACCGAPLALRADGGDSDLRFVVIAIRHGVRPPLAKDADTQKMAAQDWPKWEVPPDFLTPRGAQLVAQLGNYYRARYLREGLLTGNTAVDAPRVYFYSDNDERNIESARVLGRALLAGAEPDVQHVPPRQNDPLFKPWFIPLGHPSFDLARAAVLGRIGNDVPALIRAHQPALDLLQRVLFGPSGQVPAGKVSPLSLPARVVPVAPINGIVGLEPFHKCMTLTEDFLLEYEDGKPMSDVGWGRITPASLTRLLELHALYWELAQRTFYVAQAQSSNLAAHILHTLDQAVTDQPEKGAFGAPADRLVVVDVHDTNLINLSGLLGITWTIPGMQMNPVLPGSALVFELRQRHRDGQFLVRIEEISQTLDQMRTLQALSLEHPPYVAPIFLPDCSAATPGWDAPYGKFKALMERVIDPQFTKL
jgi:4-phytase/acid phosphatase